MAFMSLLKPLQYDANNSKRILKDCDAICTLIEDLREAADIYYSSDQSDADKDTFCNSYTNLMKSAVENTSLNQHAFWGQSALLVIARFFVALVECVKQTTPYSKSRFFDARSVIVKELDETLEKIKELAEGPKDNDFKSPGA